MFAAALRVGDVGVRDLASLAMLETIDFVWELRMLRVDEAERRRSVVRQAFRDVDGRRHSTEDPAWQPLSRAEFHDLERDQQLHDRRGQGTTPAAPA